ncbi:MAG: hypothetical protein WKF89_11415 [Chitinophagaceae bacterium]
MKLFLPILSIYVLACNNPSGSPSMENEGKADPLLRPAVAKQTITDLFDEAGDIDSLVILYYSDKIKFRYYRFYTTASEQHLKVFKENLQSDTIANNQCLKDGTIYGYKQGKIYTTIYFNLSDQCKFLRLFKNGRLYDYPLNHLLQEALKRFKKSARDP